ncbi:guanitoxin biosynthesis L-enduracididine beta-hydroxylase GntD [Micromonospora sp. DT233]|uniref:guanitoxin biosynthesis L-enduracididine beta-hydroxylase GntD n=1 Tax=Micromonospora sp. DT233 TaxID=3393432 RepID=UPI003CEA6A9E
MTSTLPTTTVAEVELTDADRTALAALLARLQERYDTPEDPDFLRRAATLGAALPEAVLERIRDMRHLEASAALVLRGGPVPTLTTPTPDHWSLRPVAASVPHDFWLALVCSQLGEPMAWSTLQHGSVFNDVAPVRGAEQAQTGQGSTAELEFHVEDAFDDDRCDYFGLLALRNVDAVATTVASIGAIDLDDADAVLFEPRFLIRPDPEHVRGAGGRAPTPKPCAVLFGAPDAPYLRVDPAFTDALPGDRAAAEAFASLCRRLDAAAVPVALSPGDLLLLDNYRSVHGRQPFRPRYDGTDRWLRKLAVTRDLRRSRARRSSPDDRVIAVR